MHARVIDLWIDLMTLYDFKDAWLHLQSDLVASLTEKNKIWLQHVLNGDFIRRKFTQEKKICWDSYETILRVILSPTSTIDCPLPRKHQQLELDGVNKL